MNIQKEKKKRDRKNGISTYIHIFDVTVTDVYNNFSMPIG